jgi:hypothetical protein
MGSDESEKIDDVAEVLSDLKTTVEEVEDAAPPGLESETVDQLKDRLDKAIDAADDLSSRASNRCVWGVTERNTCRDRDATPRSMTGDRKAPSYRRPRQRG